MSDEEHQFESKVNASASKTYLGRPVPPVPTSKTGKHGHVKCHFVAIDIFTGKKLKDILIDISKHGFVSLVTENGNTKDNLLTENGNTKDNLLTENGNTKDDLKLPTDDSLLTQIKDAFVEGKDLVVSVMSV
ncbi:hypothetical protein KIW84_010439 [Lathyrus oleraceus]|uniref:Translation elongation factor IF5A C-terminal domain-containing protein n=1 Tax=Pisum sativum TaxID=3888 RepID=A0A9D4YM47_PEA|nr:hypothetical protein KIW84_010439 [Pisum sativum]